MIQFILMLFSFVLPNNSFVNNDQNYTTQVILKNGQQDGGATTGDTGQTPPP